MRHIELKDLEFFYVKLFRNVFKKSISN